MVVLGDDVVARQFFELGLRLPLEASEVERAVMEIGHARIVTGAPYKGTPPFVYRDGWEVEYSIDAGSPVWSLYTRVPYALRIDEQGFHKVDSLGRAYDVTGKPIVRPATETLADALELGLAVLINL